MTQRLGTNERRIRIVWPEARYVPESTLAGWFVDAIENDQIDRNDAGDGAKSSLEFIAMSLHHAGLITLHREWRADL